MRRLALDENERCAHDRITQHAETLTHQCELLSVSEFENRALQRVPIDARGCLQIDEIAAIGWDHVRSDLKPNARFLIAPESGSLNITVERARLHHRVH